MSNATPDRTLEQRFDALAEANRIRSYRAKVKRDLKAGRRGFLSLFDDPDLATAKIIDLLAALPKLGRVKVNRALTYAVVSPSKTVAGLSLRQREALVFALARVSPPSRPAPANRRAA